MSKRESHRQHEARESIGDEFTEHHGNPVTVTGDQKRTRAFINHGCTKR